MRVSDAEAHISFHQQTQFTNTKTYGSAKGPAISLLVAAPGE